MTERTCCSMPVTRVPGVKRLAAALAIAFTLGAANSWAAGLGRLTVQSALGQQLRAEVEIGALDAGSSGTLVAKLAPEQAFRDAGLTFNPMLRSLRFAVQTRPDGTAFVLISSARPINEPFLEMLVELTWSRGRFVRGYTFLLDPPELRSVTRESVDGREVASPPIVSPAAAAAKPAVSTTAQQPTPPAVTPAAERAAPAKDDAGEGPIEVKRGDTLSGIAERIRPADVSLDQTLIALYQANPAAFFGSIHQLRAGAVLQVPDQSAIAAISPAEARRQVRIQTRSFQEYRARLAERARTIPTDRAGQAVAGAVTGRVKDKTDATQSADQLRLSKTDAATTGTGATGSAPSKTAGAEQTVAREAALREADSRVAELEKNVADLQQLLALKNRQLSELQGKGRPSAADAKIAVGSIASAPEAKKPGESAAPAPAAALAPAPKTVAPPATAEPSFLDDLTDNPLMLPGIGAILVLAAGYGWYAMRRRRRDEQYDDGVVDTEGFATNSLFGTTGGQNVDTSEETFEEDKDTRDSGVQVHPTEVDPVAEAEVYIAYGREAQAEEILAEALRRQPERQAIRAKLLEIYAGREDLEAFNAVAAKMHAMTGGGNEEWAQVAALGHRLDPANSLYSDLPDGDVQAGDPGELGELYRSDSTQAPSDTLTRPDQEPPADKAVMDFEFDLQIPETESPRAERAPAASSASDRSSLEEAVEGRFDLPTLDLEPPSSDDRAQGDQNRATAGVEDLKFELPALDTQADSEPKPTAESGSSVPEFDFSSISLDLEPRSEPQPSASQPAADASLSAGGDSPEELATKLELAVAYDEIGDKDGARELLQEVLRAGDASQKARAQELLGKLG